MGDSSSKQAYDKPESTADRRNYLEEEARVPRELTGPETSNATEGRGPVGARQLDSLPHGERVEAAAGVPHHDSMQPEHGGRPRVALRTSQVKGSREESKESLQEGVTPAAHDGPARESVTPDAKDAAVDHTERLVRRDSWRSRRALAWWLTAMRAVMLGVALALNDPRTKQSPRAGGKEVVSMRPHYTPVTGCEASNGQQHEECPGREPQGEPAGPEERRVEDSGPRDDMEASPRTGNPEASV